MKRVSKEEYASAILTIKSYQDQNNESAIPIDGELSSVKESQTHFIAYNDTSAIIPGSNFDLSKVRTGDALLSVSTKSKRISAGKIYKVFEGTGSAIKIMDDSGGTKYLSRDNKFKLWMVVPNEE